MADSSMVDVGERNLLLLEVDKGLYILNGLHDDAINDKRVGAEESNGRAVRKSSIVGRFTAVKSIDFLDRLVFMGPNGGDGEDSVLDSHPIGVVHSPMVGKEVQEGVAEITHEKSGSFRNADKRSVRCSSAISRKKIQKHCDEWYL